ncbi:MAG TPA: hypothetical protein VKV02_11230 [Acidobacteriaceae bacterium]|nr:hypothetical protein [Acidobacteriaceae bacterium]
MRRNLTAAFCSLFVPVLLALSSFSLSLACNPRVRGAQPVDITVRVFPTVGVAMPQLLDRDFRAYVAGAQVPLKGVSYWSRTGPPVEAILDPAQCSPGRAPSVTELAPDLARMRKLGWHVDTVQPVTQGAAEHQGSPPSEAQALNSLAQDPAVHLLFVLCSSASTIPPALVQAAERALTPVFAITPGAPLYGEGSELGASIVSNTIGQAPAYSDLADPLQDRLLPTLAPLNQPTLAAAIKTAQQIRPQFFILHMQKAPGTSAIHLRVRIRGYSSTGFRILAQSYTQGSDAPAIILDN